MSCRACEIAGGAIDYSCVACCTRLLMSLPDLERRRGHMDAMIRFNKGNTEFEQQLKSQLEESWKKRKKKTQPA